MPVSWRGAAEVGSRLVEGFLGSRVLLSLPALLNELRHIPVDSGPVIALLLMLQFVRCIVPRLAPKPTGKP